MKLVKLHNPLGSKLKFHHMSASEQLSQVPKYNLELLSEDPDIDFTEVLGQHMTVELDLPEGTGEATRQTFVAGKTGGPGKRYFDGIVSRISYTGKNGSDHQYSVVVQPWLAFLNNTQDYKIFQGKPVIEILKDVFADAPGAKFEDKTTALYTKWEYCVQYAETDLNFVLRLMEQEGITFYFTHQLITTKDGKKEGEHTLVLADSLTGHSPFNGYEAIPYQGQEQDTRKDAECIHTWQRTQQVKPGRVVVTDYDFTRPNVDLQQRRQQPPSHNLADMEIFSYPGYFNKEVDGEQFVRNQMEAQALLTEQARGSSNARGLACGHRFKLQGFIRTKDNISYLVTGTNIWLTQAQEAGMNDGVQTAALLKTSSDLSQAPRNTLAKADRGPKIDCDFTVINASVPFRPQSLTPKPRVPGPQTAVVVGPEGEEIHTDEYGQVKVHFHWDRYGKKDGDDTCWVRVSQVWAGNNFGFQAVPRIGQEVIVDFLEGDPDQPLITGRVYNAKQMAPWDLPANKTQTGVLTRSTSGGDPHTANALRFEDKRGEEEIWFHAEKHYRTEVENSETKTVGANRSKTIGKNETNHIKGNRTETVGELGGKEGTGDEKITVYGNRTEEVGVQGKGGDEKITIHGKRTEQVELDEQITINGNRYALVNQGENTRIRGNRAHVVGKNLLDQVAGNKRVAIGQNYNIEAGDTFSITCGASVFYMDKDGNVFITGKNFNFTASEKVQINGQEEVHLNPEQGAAAAIPIPSPKGAKAIGESVRAQFKSTW
jgi:type VI secretion system secreted protein VgrG